METQAEARSSRRQEASARKAKMLAEARATHPDLRYCPDCGRVTEAMIVDHRRLDIMCTECERLLADPFLAIELAAAIIPASSPPRKKRRKEASSKGGAAASVPSVRVHDDVGLGLGTSIDRARVEGFHAVSDMADRLGPATDRALLEGLDAISDMADRLGLAATVRDRAKEVFKKMEEAKAWPPANTGWTTGRSTGTLYAACLSIACRNAGSPRTLRELASVTTAGGTAASREIAKLTAHIRKRLGEEAAGQATGIGVVRASRYLRYFNRLLEMGDQEVAAAREAARRLEECDLDLRFNPESVAAGIIFMTTERAGDKKSIKDVAVATGVTEGTISAVYRNLRPHAQLLFG